MGGGGAPLEASCDHGAVVDHIELVWLESQSFLTHLDEEQASNPFQAPRVRVLLEVLLSSLENYENDLGAYEGGLLACDRAANLSLNKKADPSRTAR